jgi:excinuclease UvrABC nuclease subunit
MKINDIYTVDVRDDGGYLFLMVKTDPTDLGIIDGFKFDKRAQEYEHIVGSYGHSTASIPDLMKHIRIMFKLQNQKENENV